MTETESATPFTIPEEQADAAPADAMTRLAALASALVKAKTEAYRLDQLMVAQEVAATRLEREDIPELMRECRFTQITLEDASVITLKNEFEFGVTEANRPAAHRWLRAHELGGIIKIEVSVPFGRDEGKAALALQSKLLEEGLAAVAGESVHYQTMKATLKELREKGASIPADLFGIFPFDIAVLKLPPGIKPPGKLRKRA